MKSMKTLKAAIAAAVLTASTPALAEVTFGALFPFSGGLALLPGVGANQRAHRCHHPLRGVYHA